jgi:hypothetical protein
MPAVRDQRRLVVSVMEGGMADTDSRLGRMCSQWRQLLHAAGSPLSGVMEKQLSSICHWWTPMHQRENNST